jgi:hypothetical protein
MYEVGFEFETTYSVLYSYIYSDMYTVNIHRVLRRIFGPKTDEVTGGWRKVHNEELHNLYSSPYLWMIKSEKMMWAGHVARMGKIINAYNILVGMPEGKSPLGRPGHRWKDVMKIYFGKEGWGVRTGLVWLRIGTGSGGTELSGSREAFL